MLALVSSVLSAWLDVSVVRSVLELVVTTMADVAVDLHVAPAATVIPAPMFATTVAVPVPAAPAATVASTGRAVQR